MISTTGRYHGDLIEDGKAKANKTSPKIAAKKQPIAPYKAKSKGLLMVRLKRLKTCLIIFTIIYGFTYDTN